MQRGFFRSQYSRTFFHIFFVAGSQSWGKSALADARKLDKPLLLPKKEIRVLTNLGFQSPAPHRFSQARLMIAGPLIRVTTLKQRHTRAHIGSSLKLSHGRSQNTETRDCGEIFPQPPVKWIPVTVQPVVIQAPRGTTEQGGSPQILPTHHGRAPESEISAGLGRQRLTPQNHHFSTDSITPFITTLPLPSIFGCATLQYQYDIHGGTSCCTRI